MHVRQHACTLMHGNRGGGDGRRTGSARRLATSNFYPPSTRTTTTSRCACGVTVYKYLMHAYRSPTINIHSEIDRKPPFTSSQNARHALRKVQTLSEPSPTLHDDPTSQRTSPLAMQRDESCALLPSSLARRLSPTSTMLQRKPGQCTRPDDTLEMLSNVESVALSAAG